VNNTDFRSRYGPWAVVAGASAGLGAEYATQLAVRGLNLVLIARRKEMLDELGAQLAEEYSVEVRTLELDLASEESGPRVAEFTGDIEVGLLVYNAAVSIIGPFFETPLQKHLDEIDVNVRGVLTLTYLLGRRMLERKRGGMLLMSSLSSLQGSALIANYTATKAYDRLLAEGLWEELRTQGIDVLVCIASSISTPGYLASQPEAGPVSAMTPRAVATEALAALGKQPTVIPGRGNRMASVVMQRLLPHKMAIQIMGRVIRGMYQKA